MSTSTTRKSQVAWIALAQVLAMTLWFSATAVLPALEKQWSLGSAGSAWLTASVQLGFVVGALTFAYFNVPDRVSPRRLSAICAALGATANLMVVVIADTVAPAMVLRFVTGFALAGVYPPAMKLLVAHVPSASRGLAIGILVGALTLGSATPHLLATTTSELSATFVLSTASAFGALAALILWLLVDDGEATPSAPFDPRQLLLVFRNRGVRLASFGYFGHMWELYAMWTWLATFVASGTAGGEPQARVVAFAGIGVAGALGSVLGGAVADRVGRTRLTIVAMAISGTCCAASPLFFDLPVIVVVAFVVVWGASAVADSAQFSAAVTELADPTYLGTALTLQTSIGFALTMVPIWGLPYLAAEVGWRWAFVALAPGPFLGCIAMARLRSSDVAQALAGGRR